MQIIGGRGMHFTKWIDEVVGMIARVTRHVNARWPAINLLRV